MTRHLPIGTTATVTVRAPAGTPVRAYPIGVSVSAPGTPTVRRTASVSVREPLTCAPAAGAGCPIDLGAERTVDGTATVAAPAAAGTTMVLAMPHRIKAGQGIDGPPVSLFGVRLPVPAGRQVRSITLPDDPRLHLYAVTLA